MGTKFLGMVVVLAVAVMATPTRGANWRVNSEARELGWIIGAADVCSLGIDDKRAADVISSRLAEMPVDARNTYELAVSGRQYRLTNMAATEKAVACAVHRKLAKKYGLLE